MPLTTSGTASRQAQNIDIFGFELSDADLAAISALSRADGGLFGGDPDRHEEQ